DSGRHSKSSRELPGKDTEGLRMKLNQASIAAIKRAATGKADHVEWDDNLSGFGLRMRDGRLTWIVQYKIGGKQRRVTLGTTEQLTAEQARNGWTTENGEYRQGAAKILVDVRGGYDYATERATRRNDASHTVGAVITKYLAHKESTVRAKTYGEIRRHLEHQ